MSEIRIDRLRGRNGFDPPLQIPDDQAQEMLNVDLYEGQIGRKRGGTTQDTVTFASGGPFTGVVVSLIRHVPGADDSAMELWAIDNAATPVVGRKAASTQYVAVTLKDNIVQRADRVMAVSFNGKLFFAGWDSTVNRAQVWDGSTVRRAGVGTPAAPTAATLGGAGLTFTRYYKQAYTAQSGGVTLRRSELSPSVSISITDDSGVQVTKAAAINEGETHWETYVSDDDVTYYPMATTVVGTSTVNDTAATIDETTAAPVPGTNTPPPSARFVATDGNRVLWYSGIETAAGDAAVPKNSRVWYSAVLGAGIDSIGDDERVPIQSVAGGLRYYIDIGENDGGEPRGLAGPLYGSMYAFQSNGFTELVPTSRDNAPYRRYQRKGFGLVSQKSIVMAPDAQGNDCLYFLCPNDGPRRLGKQGLEWLGADVKDIWDTVNLDASLIVAHGVYHADKSQIWWWVATGDSVTPDTLIVFDISEGVASYAEGMPAIRKGWVQFANGTGASEAIATAACSCMFSVTPGATMPRRMVPYIGLSEAVNSVNRCDTSGVPTVQAYIDSKPYAIGDLTNRAEILGGTLVAEASSGAVIELTVTKDFGLDRKRDYAALSPEAQETRVVRRFQEIAFAGLRVVTLRIGDASEVQTAWTLDELTLPTRAQEPTR